MSSQIELEMDGIDQSKPQTQQTQPSQTDMLEKGTKPVEGKQKPPVADGPWYKYTGITLFATVMGIGGLGLVFKKLASFDNDWVFEVDKSVGDGILYFSAAMFAIYVVLYLIKAFTYFEEVVADFKHPIRANFFPAINISLLIFAVGLIPDNKDFARVLTIVGAAAQLLLSVIFIRRWWLEKFNQQHCNPTCLIPIVGNMLVMIPAGKLHGTFDMWNDVAVGYFGLAAFMWILLTANLFSKLTFGDAIPPKLNPAIFILVAPGAIGMIGWKAIFGNLYLPFNTILFWIGFFFLLIAYAVYPLYLKTFKMGFKISWWAFTFPLDAFAISTLEYWHTLHNTPDRPADWMEWLSFAAVINATLTVVVIVVFFIRALFKKDIFVPE